VDLSKIPKIKWGRVSTTLLAVIIFALAIYLGIQSWDNYKAQQEQEKILLEQQMAQREVDAQAQKKKLDDLNKQLGDLKNRPPEVRVETKTVVVEGKDTTSDIVKEWSPRVAYIECTWAYSDTGKVYAAGSGSATLINYTSIGVQAVTNKHVVQDEKGYAPRDCQVILPGVKSYSIVNDFKTKINVGSNEDWGFVKLAPDSILNNITAPNIKLCSSVNVGDKLLVLGYPGIGSKTGLTVTEGIVSGYDGNYYITSAKIDHGNSGGAAILIKDDCYLGIPSSAAVGTIESLKG
jgi:hypothetical protein